MKCKLALILVSLFWVVNANAAELPFVVKDIKLQGLQKVDPSIVFRNFPVDVGTNLTREGLSAATRQLFESGYFDDIRTARDDQGDLILVLKERPSIALIKIDGNKQIKTSDLKEGLKQSGLQSGDVFRRSVLDQIQQDLVGLYVGQGRYGAKVDTEVKKLSGNRVELDINIDEGVESIIQHINIVGNTQFSNEELIDLFSMKLPSFWDFYTKNDRYSREKMKGDLERLRSYYMDRGYINFKIDSAQVSITPDKKDVFITINVTEGDRYKVKGVSIAGDMVVDKQKLKDDLKVHDGDVFSRKAMTDSKDAMAKTLGTAGYYFANISPVPQINDEDKTVSVRYYIKSGKRIYVRRININGNELTRDDVIRRQMVQMEGSLASTEDIERSKARLNRTGFFKSVDVQAKRVPGVDDQVDLDYTVDEADSGQVSASVGFSDSEGILFSIGIQKDNFLGSGEKVGFRFLRSDTIEEYSFSQTDPYYTMDGVSRGYSLYYRKRDYDDDDVSSYTADQLGAGVNFGYPINDYQRLRFGLTAEMTTINTYSDTARIVDEFLDEQGDDTFMSYELSSSWTDDHLDKGYMPTDGYSQGVDVEIGLPGSDLPYYKLGYNAKWYHPLNDAHSWVASMRGELGYADAMGNDPYPFWRNYFGGGLDSVRGYKSNTLGPKDDEDDAFGGNIKVIGSAELIFPTPFVKDNDSWRTLFFFDAGNVYSTHCIRGQIDCSDDVDFGELRYSVGAALSWISPVGPLSVSLGMPLNDDSHDDTEVFQFSLGQTF